MGIAVPNVPGSSSRPDFASAAYVAIALVLAFGVGMGGGAAYKVYFGGEDGEQVAQQARPSRPQIAHPAPPQNFAATTPSDMATKPSDIEKAGPDLARIEPTAPPALTPPPAPTVPKLPGLPPSIVQAAPPDLPVPEPAPQAEADTAPTVPYADATPALEAKPETQPAAKPTHVAAIPPKKPEKPAPEKPAMIAKAHRVSPPQIVALHPPPTAPGNVAGPYRVQFGAFANEDNARRVQWAIEATGLKVDVSQEPGPSGHSLYFLRSPVYSDYGAALSAAQTVQHRVNGFVNAIPIDYAILGDHAVVQQAQR
jgi:hypothetical protein